MKMFMNGCKAYSAENLSESAKLAEIQRENNSAGMCKGIIFANKKEKIKIGKHLSTLAGSVNSSAKPTGFLWEDYKIDFFAFLGVVFVPLRKILNFQG